jgi:hypothetical protein
MKPWKLEFDAPANGRLRQATVTVIDAADGKVKFTDKADLESLRERDKLYKRLAERLPGVELKDLEEVGEAAWSGAVQKRREEQQARAAEAQAAASQAKVTDNDPEAEEHRRLEATPADIREEASALLRDPDLIDRISDDIVLQGVAGEKHLAATLYLVFTSRKLRRPLAARVRGPSTSGKSHVIEGVARLMPPEAVIHATQMTPQALFYMRPGTLRHKLIVAGERSRNEQDEAAEATRALREMISAGRLTKLLPVKVGDTFETQLIEQEGPIAFVESTTLGEVFAEDENRALPLYTDERSEQTRRILTALGEQYAGRAAGGRDAERVLQVHHAAQRMLSRRDVIIPFADRIGALLPAERVEVRRAFPVILSMVQASALLHQFQRQLTEDGRLIAERCDYQVVALLLAAPMRRLLGNGISEPARRFAERLRDWFDEETFTTAEAKAKENNCRRSVHGWLAELRSAAVVEQVEASRGNRCARYRLPPEDAMRDDAGVLPTVAQVFGDDAR